MIPSGVRAAPEALLALRRYGPEMRRLLALDAERAPEAATAAPAQGMDYVESRPYTPGDDVRRIDWRVTARTGRTHTKLFRLERGRDLYCVADLRASMRFGTRAAFKSVVAAHLAALAGWAAAAGGERFGALIAGAREQVVSSGAAEASAAALCAALAAASNAAAGAGAPLDRLAAHAAAEAAAGTRFLVVSDFADAETALAGALKILRARGEVTLAWIFDAMELRLPPPGRYPLTDGAAAELVLDTAQARVRAAHARESAERRARLARHAAEPGVRAHAVGTGEDLFAALGRPFGKAK